MEQVVFSLTLADFKKKTLLMLFIGGMLFGLLCSFYKVFWLGTLAISTTLAPYTFLFLCNNKRIVILPFRFPSRFPLQLFLVIAKLFLCGVLLLPSFLFGSFVSLIARLFF